MIYFIIQITYLINICIAIGTGRLIISSFEQFSAVTTFGSFARDAHVTRIDNYEHGRLQAMPPPRGKPSTALILD
jgi:hypothetical protein